jgi:hypothetical protein
MCASFCGSALSAPATLYILRVFDVVDVFAGIDMRDTAAASHATETIAEEDASEVPQEDGEKHVNKTLIAGAPRKKASSVSFSSDLEREAPTSTSSVEVVEKPESKRAKVHNNSTQNFCV